MEECLRKTVKELKEELKVNNVPGRSKLTTKEQMCQALLALKIPQFTSVTSTITKSIQPPQPNLTNILSLPKDAQLLILKRLPAEDLLNICEVNKRYNQLCKDNDLWEELYLQEFGPILADPNLSSYDNYRLEFINREKLEDDKIDDTKSWTQNWKEFNEFELVTYICRPFAGVFRKITPMNRRISAFPRCDITGVAPITFYDNIVSNKFELYYIYQTRESNPVSPLFKSQADMNDYRKKMGWKYGGENKRFIRTTYNYTTGSRLDLLN